MHNETKFAAGGRAVHWAEAPQGTRSPEGVANVVASAAARHGIRTANGHHPQFRAVFARIDQEFPQYIVVKQHGSRVHRYYSNILIARIAYYYLSARSTRASRGDTFVSPAKVQSIVMDLVQAFGYI
ncbi:MAG: hypothetical protein RLZZ283_465 [Candidatus Parcubacteria bacterium]|jgi:hypothetical protein